MKTLVVVLNEGCNSVLLQQRKLLELTPRYSQTDYQSLMCMFEHSPIYCQEVMRLNIAHNSKFCIDDYIELWCVVLPDTAFVSESYQWYSVNCLNLNSLQLYCVHISMKVLSYRLVDTHKATEYLCSFDNNLQDVILSKYYHHKVALPRVSLL